MQDLGLGVGAWDCGLRPARVGLRVEQLSAHRGVRYNLGGILAWVEATGLELVFHELQQSFSPTRLKP